MLNELTKIKRYIDEVIETYKDLHPNEENENHSSDTSVWNNPKVEKEMSLKKIREGKYESTFRKEQREKTTKSSEGPPSLCVYGDS